MKVLFAVVFLFTLNFIGTTCEKDIRSNMNFWLYTKSNPDGIYINRPSNLKYSTFDPKKPTKFIIHGWLSSGGDDFPVTLRSAYLNSYDVNVIVLDWKILAFNMYYFIPKNRVPLIAIYLADFISQLVQTFDVKPSDIHLIGHSLGAHIAGIAGYNVKGFKIGRITGLDPALLGFGFINRIIIPNDQISKRSADFVDIIHTCSGSVGITKAIGHVDFYPNGGYMPQPGCSTFGSMRKCSHNRSWHYFADSVLYPEKPFYAARCKLWKWFCGNKETVMGELTPTTTRGKYYLKTNAESPFAIE